MFSPFELVAAVHADVNSTESHGRDEIITQAVIDWLFGDEDNQNSK